MRNVSLAGGLLLLSLCVSCTPLPTNSVAIDAETVPVWNSEQKAADTSPAEAANRPLTAWDLLPVISSGGPAGTIPERIVVQFARDIVPEAAVGSLVKGTRLSIDPAVKGALVFTSSSTLEFTPSSTFAPETAYTVQLEAVGTRDGLIRRPKDADAGWSYGLQVPRFRYQGLSVVGFEASKKEAELELSFSGPVDLKSVEKSVVFKGDSSRVNSVRWEKTEDSKRLRVFLQDKQLEHRTNLHMQAQAGIAMVGMPARLNRLRSQVELLETSRLEVLDIKRVEGPTGFFVEVSCDDAAADGYRSWFYRESVEEWVRVSPRCNPDPASARDYIEVSPAANVSIAPARNGFRILGDFERGMYTVTLKKGLQSEDGGRLSTSRSLVISVPARSPKASFLSRGRYLPRSSWRNLGIRHLNVDSVGVTVRHIPRENLVFWLSGDEEGADGRNSNVVAETKVPVRLEPDAYVTSWLDLGEIVPRGGNGVYEIQVSTGESVDTSRLVVTDLNLVAKRARTRKDASGGEIHVWALGVHDNAPVPGTRIDVIRRSGKVLGSCKTDLSGGCVLPARSDALDASPPFALLARKGSDQTFLRFSDLRLSITESFVQGENYGSDKPYRLAVWSDRGAYRPGDTVHLAGLLRDSNGLAPTGDVPVQLVLRDPHGNPVSRASLISNPAGFVVRDIDVDDFAPTGRYRAEFVLAGEVVARYGFHVEEFVPERMAVEAKAASPHQKLRGAAEVDIAARYLFGGSAAGSPTKLSCSLRPVPFRPPENGNFHYGPWYEAGQQPTTVALGTTDGVLEEEGRLRMQCPELAAGLKLEGVAELTARAEVMEAGSGRSSRAVARSQVFSSERLVGLATGVENFDGGESLNVEGVLVDWSGKTVSGKAEGQVELFLLEAEYGWMFDQRTGSERFRRYLRQVADGKREVTIDDGRFVLPVTPSRDAAGYLIRVRSEGSVSELYVEGASNDYWWWGGRDTVDETPRPLKPGNLVLSLPEEFRVGEKATVRFDAPYAGRVLMTVETDEVLTSRWVKVEAGPVEWSFTPSSFSPNLYVSALLLKNPHLDSADSFTPGRSFGVDSAPVVPEAFVQAVRLDAPSEILPGETLEVGVRVKGAEGPTWVTLAAVDPGILSLTGFEDPDPLATLFAARALGVESFETIGWTLLLPPPGTTGRTGGGAGEDVARVQMVKPVALWSGLVPVDSDGRATVRLDVPRHRGALRLMAVAASAGRVGTASGEVFVREPLMVQPTVPRFLVEGDEFEVPVFVTNTTKKPAEVQVTLESDYLLGPGSAGAPAGSPIALRAVVDTLSLKPGESGRALFAGLVESRRGGVRIKVVASGGGNRSVVDFEMPIETAKPRVRRIRRVELEPGTTDLGPLLAGWEPGTAQSGLWVSANPHADVIDHMRFLVRYPYGCLEQTTSTTRPLLYVGTELKTLDPAAVSSGGVDEKVGVGLRRILSMQTASGGFSYWPGSSQPNTWGTAYATHFLIEAREAGHAVPKESVDAALTWMESQLTDGSDGAGQPYLHYVLARAGRARKAQAADRLAFLSSTDLRGRGEESRYLLKAALWLAGDRSFEADLRAPNLPEVTDERGSGWNWYSDRRRRGLVLNVMVDLFGADPAVDAVAEKVADSLRGMPSRGYTTQELAWGVSGLGRWGRASAEGITVPSLEVAGKVRKPARVGAGGERSWVVRDPSLATEPKLVWNAGAEERLWMVVSSHGVASDLPAPVGGNGLTVSRTWQRESGQPLRSSVGGVAPSQLGEILYTTIHLTNRGKERVDNVALVDRVPAGWEIENPSIGGQGLPSWLQLETTWRADHMNVRDDRVEIFGTVGAGQTVSFAYAVRAVTAGNFSVPPVEAEAMYDPRLWARELGGSVGIEGPWASLLTDTE
jgi:hypothetical protein